MIVDTHIHLQEPAIFTYFRLYSRFLRFRIISWGPPMGETFNTRKSLVDEHKSENWLRTFQLTAFYNFLLCRATTNLECPFFHRRYIWNNTILMSFILSMKNILCLIDIKHSIGRELHKLYILSTTDDLLSLIVIRSPAKLVDLSTRRERDVEQLVTRTL